MNEGQIDEMVGCIEETTAAVRGLEQKAAKFDEYIMDAKRQRDKSIGYTEYLSVLLDRLSDTLLVKSDEVWVFCFSSLDTLASLVEQMEAAVGSWGFHHASSELKKELGPLLVPAMVLVTIITISNSYFGFILAGDMSVSSTFTLQALHIGDEDGDEAVKDAFNILNLFAIFHVVLIGFCVIYVTYEAMRKQTKRRAYSTGYSSQDDSSEDGRDCRPAFERSPDSDRLLARRLSGRSALLAEALQHRRSDGSDAPETSSVPAERRPNSGNIQAACGSPRAAESPSADSRGRDGVNNALTPSGHWHCPSLDLDAFAHGPSPSESRGTASPSSLLAKGSSPGAASGQPPPGVMSTSPLKKLVRTSGENASSPSKATDGRGGTQSTTPVSAMLRGVQKSGTALMEKKQKFMMATNTTSNASPCPSVCSDENAVHPGAGGPSSHPSSHTAGSREYPWSFGNTGNRAGPASQLRQGTFPTRTHSPTSGVDDAKRHMTEL